MKQSRIWFDSIRVNENQRKALIGFHISSGNDYLSAFFWKRKQLCQKNMLEKENFLSNFIELGSSWDISGNLWAGIEKFACHLFSSSKSSVDDSRLQISEKKQLSSKQVIDLSILPPCQRTLMLHLIRVNYVARVWKSSGIALAYLLKHGTS